MRQLATFAAAVAEMGRLLATPPERLARAEALDRLEITARIEATDLLEWDTSLVKHWFTLFREDCELDLSLVGLDAALDAPGAVLRSSRDPEGALRRFTEATSRLMRSQGNELVVEARLSLAKTRAVAGVRGLLAVRPEYPGSAELMAATTPYVFYQTGSIEKLLRFGALSEWERLGLATPKGRVVIVLCDAPGYLAGMALEIVGVQWDKAPEWLAFSRAAWRQFLERADQVRCLESKESNWSGAPAVLTPAHLHLVTQTAGLEKILGLVQQAREALSACYLASSVTGPVNGMVSLRFAGARPTICHIAAGSPAAGGDKAPLSSPNDDALARLMTWAYQHASADKLAIARESLAHELPPGIEVNLASVEQAAGGALEAAKANFALYLHGNTAQYFQLRQQALDMVSGYAAGVRKAVSDLTADVVDNVYRTIGLLIGVVIASLIQPALAVTVQQIAVFVYIAYLLFLVYFLLESRRQRFELEAGDLEARLKAMPELSERERSLLRSEAGVADQYFYSYFRRSRLLYLVLAGVGALYLLLLFTPLATHLPLVTAPHSTLPLVTLARV